jgi:hypothetical protein
MNFDKQSTRSQAGGVVDVTLLDCNAVWTCGYAVSVFKTERWYLRTNSHGFTNRKTNIDQCMFMSRHQNTRQSHSMKTARESIDSVGKIKCFGRNLKQQVDTSAHPC